MARPASVINTEFDSRILRVSSGPAGVTRPRIHATGKLERAYCLNCGKPSGMFTADLPPAVKGDPGMIFICTECESKVGSLPTHATHFVRYKESD